MEAVEQPHSRASGAARVSMTAGHATAPAQRPAERARPLAPDELAWAAAIPCALIALAAALALGAPLGRALFPHGSDMLWPPRWWEAAGRAEPTKHARYLIATAAPLLLVAALLLGLRRRWSLPARATRSAVLTGQLLLVAVVAFGLLGQQGTVSFGALLASAGRLPDPAVLMEWPRVFTSLGWFALPVPVASLHLAVFATFAAAFVAGAVRATRGERDLLTGMLVWSGVLGLVAGSYYVGRAEDDKLVALFSAWGFSLMLLTVACVRALTARGWRGATPAQLLVLFGFAVAACSFAALPSPVAQLRRLTSATPELLYRPAAEAFVREQTRRGEKVAILLPEGDRIAYDLGLEDVSPYGFIDAVVTRRQMQTVIDTVRRERVRNVFLPAPSVAVAGEGNTAGAQVHLLAVDGYVTVAATHEGFLELRR